GARAQAPKEPEQCPVIDSQGAGPAGALDLVGSLPVEERSLEQVQSLVLGEVLKDIETACKLLNIAAGGCPRAPAARLVPRRALICAGSACCSRPTPWPSLCAPLCPECKRFVGGALGDPHPCSRHPRGVLGLCPWMRGARVRVAPALSPSASPGAAGDGAWTDSEVDSSCAGQPIHLWQFLKELLLKPHNYGRFIRWLNKEKGIFKIEDSAQVARLWGIRKNRPAMNYDKLSRSIRQYYKKGIIRKPDISQRLVYQFVHPL
ncbi:SPDEF factor, partial [Nothoprocta pentlandii]|nr:SPDEF factor [Nothoprocta pentlandii]